MKQSILDNAISGKIQNELLRLGYKCDAGRLVWFTDKPIHKKSEYQKHGPGDVELSKPYITSLGYKTAVKFYKELKERRIQNENT